MSKKSILAALCSVVVVTAIADNNGGPKAKGWYTDLMSQENPYIMGHVRELGRKISKERGGPIDDNPTGWFLEFLHERVRGKLFAEALAARKKGETSTRKLTLKIKINSKNLKC